MTTVKFQIVSDEYGLFNADSLSYTDEQLNCHVTRDQYSSIILKINQRMKKFKSPMNSLCLIGLVIITLAAIMFAILKITLESDGESYDFLIMGLVLIAIIGFATVCSGACEKFNREKNKQRFRKLQYDIQKIADEEFMTIYQIAYSKWTIEKIGNRESGKKFKLTAEFRRQQSRAIPATVPSVPEPIDWRAIRLDPPAETLASSALVLDLEPVITPLNNEQHSQYFTRPATPPPPSYYKVVYSFSQGIFSDCPTCSTQKCVFNGKYCTQCGHSLLI